MIKTYCDICKTLNDIDRLIDIMLQDKHNLTSSEIQEICNILWDYREDLMKKEVK